MKSSHVRVRASVPALLALGFALGLAGTATAEPTDTTPVPPEVSDAAPAPVPGPPPAPGPDVTVFADESAAAGDPAIAACSRFAGALDLAAVNYGDFADAIAGPQGNYADPIVESSNVTGRTALRMAVAEALGAANTPGLQPEIANPMRSWSMHATKLLLVMGVRGGSDTLNSTAEDVNVDTSNVQMACAMAGTHA